MQDTFTVAPLGFNATEQLVLGSIFGLAARRAPKFVRHTDAARRPDIYLVDADDASAMSEVLTRNTDRRVPVILVGASDHGTGWPRLSRPLQWARLIVAFDHSVRGAARPAAPAQAAAPVARAAVPVSHDEGPERVLVVSGNAQFRATLSRRLSLHAVVVACVDAPEDAREALDAHPHVCVFVDLNAEPDAGYALCKQLKTRKAGRPIAVVLAGDGNEPFHRMQATMAGCDAFLTTPLQESRIDAVVTRYVPAAAPY